MSKILVKFDNTLKHDDIVIQLTNSSPEESGENYKDNYPEIQQTSVYGIQAPLIKVNNIVVDFTDVIEFSLKSIDALPTVTMTIRDRYELISSFDTPGLDNILRVQILPQFDNAYKKINLDFYISQIKINKNYINLSGTYKLPKLTSSNIKSFGEINTYDLFEAIAKETGLGLASNIDSNDYDKRYIYCDNKSYMDLMRNEIKRSGQDLQILDYWIDYWNNLTIADIYERYNSTDSDEDMQIWVSSQTKEIGEGVEVKPIQISATLTNNPNMSRYENYITNYNIINKCGSGIYMGTDKLYSVYGDGNKEYLDYLVQDGDVKQDVFTKYEYVGEYYGNYNYLLAEKKRADFIQKINTESIEIELKTPLLGIMRGNKINILIYKNDDNIKNKQESLEQSGMINKDPETYIPIEDNDDIEKSADGNFTLDKSLSGQYLITACNIKFYNNSWHYLVTLNRPASNKTQILNV